MVLKSKDCKPANKADGNFGYYDLQKIQTGLEYFKKLLKCEFILAGGLTLHLFGIREEKPNDVDIIIDHIDEAGIEILKRLCERKVEQWYGENVVTIYHEGVKYDFFIKTDNPTATITVPNCTLMGCKVKDLGETIKEKRNMRRPKDVADLLKISKRIITNNELMEWSTAFK